MNLIYYNEIQKIISIRNALENQFNSLSKQNNSMLYNQSIGASPYSIDNSIPDTFLQRKSKPDDLNCLFTERNAQSPCLIQKRGQNLGKNDENKENQIDVELERIKMNNNINSNSNNNIMNNSNLFENNNNKFEKVNNLFFNKNINSYKGTINQNLINNQSTKINSNINSVNPNFIKQNENFYIQNIDLEEKSNGGNEKEMTNEKVSSSFSNFENNNEIKVVKNNKVVYVNSYLLKSPSTSRKIKKLDKVAFISRSKRSSRFRGVSKNGNQWQVLLMHKKGKSYVGNYNSEELAAKIYDILALKYRGIKARTNFKYTHQQIKKIGEIDFDINSKNLADIVNELEILQG